MNPNLTEELLSAREKNIVLREQVVSLREQALASLSAAGRPIVLNSRLVHFGTRKDVAKMLNYTPDTISDLVADGTLPPPCDLTAVRNHNAAKLQGRRILLWDLHEVAEWVLRSRRLPHPALSQHQPTTAIAKSPGDRSFGFAA